MYIIIYIIGFVLTYFLSKSYISDSLEDERTWVDTLSSFSLAMIWFVTLPCLVFSLLLTKLDDDF